MITINWHVNFNVHNFPTAMRFLELLETDERLAWYWVERMVAVAGMRR